MYKLCKTEAAAIRQRELENGLLAAMGTQHYEQISVSDLCEQLGIPRKAFYRYFSGKEGALYALIDHTLLEYESLRWNDSRHDGGHQLEDFFLFWQGKGALLDALERSGLIDILFRRSVHHVRSERTGTGRFRNDYERDQSLVFVVCGMMSMMLRWHREGHPVSAEQMADFVLRMLSGPLLSELKEL